MRILIISDAYPPEIRSISAMVRELAEDLASRGHKVTVATCWPQYNLSSDVKEDGFKPFCREGEVDVIRIKTLPHHKVSFIIRGVAQLLLPFLFQRGIAKYVRGELDAVIIYSPPLPLARIGASLKNRGAKFILNVQDIFPQVAVDLGALKNPWLIWFFERMERKCYEKADKITTHTMGSRQFLIEKKQVPPAKVSTIHNWIDLDAFRRARATGEFRTKYGLEDKFIFLFPGILGPVQHLDFILEVAQRVRDILEIVFLFVGDGSQKAHLQGQAKEWGLSNVRFEDFVSMDRYPALLKEADVGMVCLGKDTKVSSIPGKVQGFMAASLSMVAFLNRENDAHELIQEAKCGYPGFSEDPEKAAQVIRDIFADRAKLEQWGRNGYEYAASHFSKENSIERFLGIIE